MIEILGEYPPNHGSKAVKGLLLVVLEEAYESSESRKTAV